LRAIEEGQAKLGTPLPEGGNNGGNFGRTTGRTEKKMFGGVWGGWGGVVGGGVLTGGHVCPGTKKGHGLELVGRQRKRVLDQWTRKKEEGHGEI